LLGGGRGKRDQNDRRWDRGWGGNIERGGTYEWKKTNASPRTTQKTDTEKPNEQRLGKGVSENKLKKGGHGNCFDRRTSTLGEISKDGDEFERQRGRKQSAT